MYENWYSQQYHQYYDSFSSQWEIFGVRFRGSSEKIETLVRLSAQEILTWLDSDADGPTSSGIEIPNLPVLSLIFTRHIQHREREIRPCYLALSKDMYKTLFQTMKLPSAYPFMRVNAGASGTFAKYSTYNEDGTVSHLSFVIRVPHSPRTNEKAVWSLAATWECNTQKTSALFESTSNEDMQEVRKYISDGHRNIQHPLFLATMLLDLLIIFYVDHRRKLEDSLFKVESQLGITRGQRKTDAWDWDYELHRGTTKHCNTVYTSLVYLERQLDFAVRLGDFVLQSIAYCHEEEIFLPVRQKALLRSSKELKESVTNDRNFANCQLHQVLCLQKRAQALVSVMYSIVAQKDSRTNVGIAQAAKRDSSSMTAIAVLGILFLPAMLISSIFSTSMFEFSTSNSSSAETSSSMFVSSHFWMFWAITIPLTLAVLGTWKIWMGRIRRTSAEDQSQKDEEMIVYQGFSTSFPPLDPFYP